MKAWLERVSYRRHLPLAAILLLGTVFRVYGLASQPLLEDETMSVFTAEHYVEHGQFGPIEPFHPNLRNLVLYASTEIFGTGVVGVRGPSAAMGIASIWLLFVLMQQLLRDRHAALFAAFFLAVDPVHITFSRQSIQEVHTAALCLLGLVLFVRALSIEQRWKLVSPLWLPVAGVAFGLAVASKHQGLFPLLACVGVAGFMAIRDRAWNALAFVVVALVLVPATVYLVTYYPWFGRGYGLGEWLWMQWALAKEMIAHTGYATSSTLYAEPWQWFLNPLVGYANFTLAEGHPVVTLAMGNAVVWLLTLPAAFYLMGRERRTPAVLFIALVFWISYAPLVLSPRPIWLLSSVAVIPFGFALIGAASSSLGLPARRWACGAFVAVVLAVSVLMFPLASAQGWDYGYLRPLVERLNPH